MYVNLCPECINLFVFFCIPFYTSRTCAILAYHLCLINDESEHAHSTLQEIPPKHLVYEADTVQISREYRKIFIANVKLQKIPLHFTWRKSRTRPFILLSFSSIKLISALNATASDRRSFRTRRLSIRTLPMYLLTTPADVEMSNEAGVTSTMLHL